MKRFWLGDCYSIAVNGLEEKNGMSDANNSISGEKNGREVHKRVGLAAEVFGKYGDDILAVIRFNVDDQSRANDIFQDFFVSLVRKPIPPYVKDVKGYLYKAITNDVIDSSRRTRNLQNNTEQYAYYYRHRITQEDPQEMMIHAEETERMLSLIKNHLPKHEAGVFLKRRGDGLSTTDTANILQLSKRTVSHYLTVATKKIRQIFKNHKGMT